MSSFGFENSSLKSWIKSTPPPSNQGYPFYQTISFLLLLRLVGKYTIYVIALLAISKERKRQKKKTGTEKRQRDICKHKGTETDRERKRERKKRNIYIFRIGVSMSLEDVRSIGLYVVPATETERPQR